MRRKKMRKVDGRHAAAFATSEQEVPFFGLDEGKLAPTTTPARGCMMAGRRRLSRRAHS